MLNLKSFKKKYTAFSSLLTWAALVYENTILGKDGSFLSGWFYEGVDMNYKPDFEQNNISDLINNALLKLGSSFVLHVDLSRCESGSYIPKEDSFFSSKVSEMIDEERRELFEGKNNYITQKAMFLSWLPPNIYSDKISQIFVDKKKDSSHFNERFLKEFIASKVDFESSLKSVLNIKPMREYVKKFEDKEVKYSEILEYLNYSLKGYSHPLAIPKCPMYLDAILGKCDFHTGFHPKIEEQYIGIVSICGFPSASYPLVLSFLQTLPLEYRWSTRFIFMDKAEAMSKVKTYHKRWKQKVRGIRDQFLSTDTGMINHDALEMSSDAQMAISDISSGTAGYGFYTSCVVFFDRSIERVNFVCREIKHGLETIGFNSKIETINAVESYLGSLPGNGIANVNQPLLSTMNLSDLLPINLDWRGNRYNPNPMYPPKSPPLMYAQTEGLNKFKLSLAYKDVGNTLIFGAIGSGKSTFLAFIAAQFLRYKNSKVFVFDKGNSLKTLTQALGGTHYLIGSEGFCFSPLLYIDQDAELVKAQVWLEALIELQGIKVDSYLRDTVFSTLKLMQDSNSKTLTDFYLNVQDEKIKSALKLYLSDGQYGYLFDNKTDSLLLDTFSTFETNYLFQLGKKAILPALMYIFNRIETMIGGDPSMIILDEAWLMFSDGIFKDKLKEWLKTKRKENCSIVMATQSLSDAKRSGIMDVLAESCPNKIFLANNAAKQEDQYNLYTQLGLNPSMIEAISSLEAKKDYFFVNPYGQKVFQPNLGPLALSLCGVSSKKDLLFIENLQKEDPKGWLIKYLECRGIKSEKDNSC